MSDFLGQVVAEELMIWSPFISSSPSYPNMSVQQSLKGDAGGRQTNFPEYLVCGWHLASWLILITTPLSELQSK